MNRSHLKLYASIIITLYSGALGVGQNYASFLMNPQSQLVHFPVTTAHEGVTISIEAKVDGTAQVIYCRIYYRSKGEESYQYIDMQQSLEGFTGHIPAEDVKPPVLEYFISSVLRSKQLITSPASNPYYAPYVVNVNPDTSRKQITKSSPDNMIQLPDSGKLASTSSSTKSDFLILSPEPGEIIQSEELVIAATLISTYKKVDVKSIQLFLDGKNVSKKAEIAHGIVSCVPKRLKSGKHRIDLIYKTKTSKKRRTLNWRFQVSSTRDTKAPDPSRTKEKMLHGNAFIDLKNEAINSRKLETYVAGGNFYGKYSFLKYYTRLYLTSLEEKTSQPRNRYSIGIDGDWFGFNFGDTNPRFNDLILWGRRVRGIEAFIKTGFFNFEFITGETRRAVEGVTYEDFKINPITSDTLYYNPTTSDTVNDENWTEYTAKPAGYEYVKEEKSSLYGTYQRLLTGFRPSFGSGKNFQLGFNFLKVKDQVSSISLGSKPKDNLVLGSDLLIAFDNHRVELRTGIAFSLLTDDISPGPLTKAGIDSTFDTNIPFDPSEFEKYLILNTSTVPLDPSGMNSLAYNLKFRLNYFNNNLYIAYKSIGSEYNSLGNSYLKTDIQGILINDRLRLFRNRVLLSLGYDRYDDNFSQKDNNPITDLNTFHINASIFPPKKLPKISFSYRSHSRNNGLTLADSMNIAYAINNTTDDISVMLSYDLQFLQQNHSFNFSLITSDKVDGLNRENQNLSTGIKMLSVRTQYQVPLITYISFATTENIAAGGNYNFKYTMFDIRAEYLFLRNKLRSYVGFKNIAATTATTTNNIESAFDYTKTYISFGMNFQLTSAHSIIFDGNIIQFFQKEASSSTDSIFRLRYDFRY